jgi:hypothetical protein
LRAASGAASSQFLADLNAANFYSSQASWGCRSEVHRRIKDFSKPSAYESAPELQMWRKTQQSEELIKSVVDKADGAFLWAQLVVDTLQERLRAGRSLEDLRSCVVEFPGELQEYFRKLVYERIHSTWRTSDTAIMLKTMQIEADSDAENDMKP